MTHVVFSRKALSFDVFSPHDKFESLSRFASPIHFENFSRVQTVVWWRGNVGRLNEEKTCWKHEKRKLVFSCFSYFQRRFSRLLPFSILTYGPETSRNLLLPIRKKWLPEESSRGLILDKLEGIREKSKVIGTYSNEISWFRGLVRLFFIRKAINV